MKIAVIGAGISGLTAAYKLGARHDVVLFEAADYLGGHTNTIEIELDGKMHAVDTGFIVFNDRTYPRFVALLDELGVGRRPTEMSFSVCCNRTGLEYNGSSLNGLFAQRGNLLRPRFWRMLRDILRFNREGSRLADDVRGPGDDATTVEQFLFDGRYSLEFAEHYLLPMGAAVWSCPPGTFERFPIRFVAEFYRNHGLLSLRDRPTWQVVEGGSRTYVAAMMRRFRGRVRLATPVEQVRRAVEYVEVVPRGGEAEPFDHVVLACPADQALRMLADPTPTERELLSAFPYSRNTAVLHTDKTTMPRRRRAWAAWNYRLQAAADSPPTVTYCLNILQHLPTSATVCVTLNGDDAVDPRRVLRRFAYEHPVFTTGRAAAQARHGELIALNRTSYCGAYWRNGFHEDGVVSALAVCRALEQSTHQSPPLAVGVR